MRKTIVIFTLILLLYFGNFGCLKRRSAQEYGKYSKEKKGYEEHITQTITKDTIWEGKITVDGIIKIAKGARLIISPGTIVEFTYHDYDFDGLGDSGLFVEGSIVAAGNYESPILFTTAEGRKKSGAWGLILINFSNEVIFDY